MYRTPLSTTTSLTATEAGTYVVDVIYDNDCNGTNQDCDISNNVMNGASISLIDDAHCLEVSVAHFSEFIVHEPSAAPLPIQLVDFNAIEKNQTALLTWETASEKNNKGFHIQRSTDGRDFESIGWVDGHGNSQTANEYRFVDNKPTTGVNYYRLQQVDADDKTSYTDIKTLLFRTTFAVQVFPNPVQKGGTPSVHLTVEEAEQVVLSVFDATGKKVLDLTPTLSVGKNTISLSKEALSGGVYFIAVTHQGGTETMKLVIME